MSIPIVFWAAAACKELAFIWIGFPSGLITVTVFPKVNLMNIHSVSNHNMATELLQTGPKTIQGLLF